MPIPATSACAPVRAEGLLPYEPLSVPLPYRSEGFAEDLVDHLTPADAVAGPERPAPWGRIGTWLAAAPMAVTLLSAAASVLV